MSENGITIKDLLAPGFSTPFGAPSIPRFPFQFRDVQFLTFAWKTDRKEITKFLPPGVELLSDVVLTHIAHMNDTDWTGPFFEANTMVGCRELRTGLEGSYSLFLFLSSDSGVSQGREVHGQPKKIGYPKIEVSEDMWIGSIERNGLRFFQGTMAYKQKRCDRDELNKYFSFGANMNLKVVNNIDGSPAIRQLTVRNLENIRIDECWTGACTVELKPHIQAPLYRLPVVEMLDGFYWKATFDLTGGKTMIDYLGG